MELLPEQLSHQLPFPVDDRNGSRKIVADADTGIGVVVIRLLGTV